MKNEFETLTELLLQYPYTPMPEPQFYSTLNREAARLYQHFQNRDIFGVDVIEQYRYISKQTINMMEMHKNLGRLPNPLQAALVGSLNSTVGLIRDHLHFLVPLQPPPSLKQEEQEAAQLKEMNALIQQKKAVIDQQQGGIVDKVMASVDVYKVMFDDRD